MDVVEELRQRSKAVDELLKGRTKILKKQADGVSYAPQPRWPETSLETFKHKLQVAPLSPITQDNGT